ncbi:MAG TPA: MFS transporter [Polyangiales bacterium]|nr:MFS transporter [Polyangiales bacterium]
MNSVSSHAQPDRIPLAQLAAYGAGGIIPIALFNVAGVLVGLMGNISLGLSAFWLGVILVVPRIWDAVIDPVIGHLSDNTRTRWGRRRPYLLLGGLLVAFFFVVMWWIPKGETIRGWFPSEAGYQAFQLGYILVFLTLFFTSVTLFEIPHGALGMEMTSDPHQRTRLFSAKSFVGNLFAMSTPWLLVLANMEVFKGPLGNEADGMRYVSMLVAAVLVPLSFWSFSVLREPKFVTLEQKEKTPFWPDMKRTVRNLDFVMLTLTVFTLSMGFNFVQLLGAYIPIYYVFGGDKAAGAMLLGVNGTAWAITGLLAVFPLNWISPKLGKRNTLVVAILLITLAQLLKVVCYDPDHPYLIVIPTIPLSIGMLFFFTLGSSMVGDVCDEDELQTGSRSDGAFYSVFWWFVKTGTALASLISGALIVYTLFDESQVTKVDQLLGSVRDIRALIVAPLTVEGVGEDGPDLVVATKKQLADALQETTAYATYLDSEAVSALYEGLEGTERRGTIVPASFAVKGVLVELLRFPWRVDALRADADPKQVRVLKREIQNLRARAKLEITRVHAVELRVYLQSRAASGDSAEHYRELADASKEIGATLAHMTEALAPEKLQAELVDVTRALAALSQQSPYTLFRMRSIEIGLPLVACLFSLLFVLRYRLTEGRSREIKDQLAQRHAEGAAPTLHEGPAQ